MGGDGGTRKNAGRSKGKRIEGKKEKTGGKTDGKIGRKTDGKTVSPSPLFAVTNHQMRSSPPTVIRFPSSTTCNVVNISNAVSCCNAGATTNCNFFIFFLFLNSPTWIRFNLFSPSITPCKCGSVTICNLVLPPPPPVQSFSYQP